IVQFDSARQRTAEPSLPDQHRGRELEGSGFGEPEHQYRFHGGRSASGKRRFRAVTVRGGNACFLAVLVSLVLAPHTLAQSVALRAAGTRMSANVRSLQEIRQGNVVRQKWDLSCGSAALSTLLTYDLQSPTPETEIIVWILHRADPVKIQSRGGFSLLDLKRFAQAHGFAAEGYADLSLAELAAMRQPAIVPVRVKGYDHFVVFRGLLEDRVMLADPAFGNLTEPRARFLKTWKNGLAFFVSRKGMTPPGANLNANWEPLTPDVSAIYRFTAGRALFQPTRPLQ
ncbi:MAG TPA: C39 family peptidase, partial [Candidatus Polarisedimenticolia bacterium]|nr:C39 family peptidase [Candidatus Polarisedimenticolia bacterium]